MTSAGADLRPEEILRLVDGRVVLLDQRRLRDEEVELVCRSAAEVADAMRSAAGSLMARGEVRHVVVGADRIAANGDTANKVVTYSLALLASHHGIPFTVVVPTTTIDFETATGGDIPLDQRPGAELTDRFPAYNPAFDVTPAALLGAIVTERGVHRAPYEESLKRAEPSAAVPRTPSVARAAP